MIASWIVLELASAMVIPLTISSYLQATIFLTSFAPLVAFFGVLSMRTRKFRREWEETHASHEDSERSDAEEQ
jgi:hypothetical protein